MKNEKNRENRKNRKNRESRKRMEHIKKRFFNCPGHKKAVLFLCLCLMIIMTGCGEKNPETAEPTEAPAAVQTTGITDETEEGENTLTAEDGEKTTTEDLPTAVEEGCLAPDIALYYLDGSSAALSDYRGKTVLLNLWATWCGPCVGEMPAFPRLQEEFGDELQIIAVNCGDSFDTVKQFAEENGYTFPIALDEEYEIMMGTYRTSSIPYTVIIDESGIIRHISVGARDADTMFTQYKEAIEDAMKSEPLGDAE